MENIIPGYSPWFWTGAVSLVLLMRISNIDAEDLMELAAKTGDCSIQKPHNIQTAYEAVKFMDEMPGGFFVDRADGTEEIIYANKALFRIPDCLTDF